MVSKDIQEPIRCNNCQLYGHFKEKCISQEHCTYCACEHSSISCPNPRELHCVSCRPISNHSSTDQSGCPAFTKLAASLDTRLPENTMPFFPVLNQNWMFTMAPKYNPQPPPQPCMVMNNDVNRPPPTAAPPQPRPSSPSRLAVDVKT